MVLDGVLIKVAFMIRRTYLVTKFTFNVKRLVVKRNLSFKFIPFAKFVHLPLRWLTPTLQEKKQNIYGYINCG